jgi:hypothetical protein
MPKTAFLFCDKGTFLHKKVKKHLHSAVEFIILKNKKLPPEKVLNKLIVTKSRGGCTERVPSNNWKNETCSKQT